MIAPMERYNYRIEQDISALPRELLLLGEPDEAIVADYPSHCVAAVARADDAIVGAAVLLPDHYTFEVINLAVDESHRNHGVGTTLLETAIGHARARGVRRVVIRTASTSTAQLLLYQRIGFRLSEISHGYFTQAYFKPLIENGVRCIDQVSLVYPLYRDTEKQALIEEYWRDFLMRNPEYVDAEYRVWQFGDSPTLANQLLNLVIGGRKTATATTVEMLELEGVPTPAEGDLSIVTYGDGRPGAIVQATAVEVRAFKDIDAEHARLEGEGDLSLKQWREGHRAYFSRELERNGKSFSETMPVVCERFRLLDVNRELALA